MLDKLPSLTQVVKIHNLAANKSLGQHFLLDMNITHNIAKLAAPLDGVSVAEIGPGPGGLTRALLLGNAEKVLAIETDARFLPALNDIANHSGGCLSIFKSDALNVDITDHLEDPIKIIANLPYNVGTKLLINWLTTNPLFWTQAVLMFQKEVADRITARPGENAYGRLAILAQSVCHVRQAFDIPAHVFTPPPKIDSAVVVLDPLPIEYRFTNLTLLGQVTQAAFNQRRKMLRRSLKAFATSHNIEVEDWLQACDIAPTDRPETVSVEKFQALVRYLKTT